MKLGEQNVPSEGVTFSKVSAVKPVFKYMRFQAPENTIVAKKTQQNSVFIMFGAFQIDRLLCRQQFFMPGQSLVMFH